MNIARFLPIAGTIGLVVAIFVATQATKHGDPEITVACKLSRTDAAGLTSVMHMPVIMTSGKTASVSVDHATVEIDNSFDKNVVAVSCKLHDLNGNVISAPKIRMAIGRDASASTTVANGDSVMLDVTTTLASIDHE